jgi:hypothetical protein
LARSQSARRDDATQGIIDTGMEMERLDAFTIEGVKDWIKALLQLGEITGVKPLAHHRELEDRERRFNRPQGAVRRLELVQDPLGGYPEDHLEFLDHSPE